MTFRLAPWKMEVDRYRSLNDYYDDESALPASVG